MRSRWLSVFACVGAVSCGANVRIADDDDGGGSVSTSPKGGESSVDAAGGAPTTSAAGGSSTSGSGGSEPEGEAEALVKQQCPDVGSEPHFCVTIGYPNTLYAVGPDSGSVCYLGEIQDFASSDVSSIAVLGPYVHGCWYDVGAWRAPVLGGPVEVLPVGCEALTEYQGHFLVAEGDLGILRSYPVFAAIGSSDWIDEFEVDPQFSRIATRGDTLFTAWHSTDTVQVQDLPTGAPMPSLLLEGFDDWVDGMSVTADGRLYVLSTEGVLAFDAQTGAQLQQVSIPSSGTPLSTLHCWAN